MDAFKKRLQELLGVLLGVSSEGPLLPTHGTLEGQRRLSHRAPRPHLLQQHLVGLGDLLVAPSLVSFVLSAEEEWSHSRRIEHALQHRVPIQT